MNIMNLPGFTAEASVYKTRRHYRVACTPHVLVDGRGVLPHRIEQKIYPAFQDQNCLNDCLQNCGSVCVGSDKGSCIRICARENAACRISCEIPGNPPNGGGGMTACAPGLINCSGLCVDASVDPSNCGGCGVMCPTGSPCCGGGCGTSCPSGGCCPPPLTCSGTICCPPGFPFGVRCFGQTFCSSVDTSGLPFCSKA